MIILGLMSGTSLDGVDLALCQIEEKKYAVLAADTVAYPDEWRLRLASLEHSTALEYAKANIELGHYYGKIINDFLKDKTYKVEAIASHGHTIFHQPGCGLTTQIGDGDAIAAETGLLVVSSFRTLDVALGGQGAPLVPIGDEILFGNYDACLNLGGIANISYCADGKRIAFDISPCNMVLNRLAERLGLAYDAEGQHARAGRVMDVLESELDALGYYRLVAPKSLGKEWMMSEFWPLLETFPATTEDLLATVTHHVAGQIAAVLRRQRIGTLLVTGGGAKNSYLLEILSYLCPEVQVIIPDDLTINYKEAIIFAFLGYLRLKGKVNTLASVTGARCDSVGGVLSGRLA